MSMNETIQGILRTHQLMTEAMLSDARLSGEIEQAVNIIAHSLINGGAVLAFGNGGSAADAQHFTAELVGRFSMDRKGLRAFALTTDASVMTCISNDFGFDEVFSRQIEGLGHPGDTALAFSTSGKSPNIIKGIKTAAETGMKTVGLTGRYGGEMADMCDVNIAIPSDETPRIQEGHVVVYHILCELVEKMVFSA